MGGKMAPGRGNLRRARTMDQSQSEVAKSSQDLRSRTSAEARAVFSKGHIAHIMRGVLDAPMSSYQGKETLGRSFGRCQRSNQVDHFLARFAGFADGDGAGQFSD